jgi:hypothetical protein
MTAIITEIADYHQDQLAQLQIKTSQLLISLTDNLLTYVSMVIKKASVRRGVNDGRLPLT